MIAIVCEAAPGFAHNLQARQQPCLPGMKAACHNSCALYCLRGTGPGVQCCWCVRGADLVLPLAVPPRHVPWLCQRRPPVGRASWQPLQRPAHTAPPPHGSPSHHSRWAQEVFEAPASHLQPAHTYSSRGWWYWPDRLHQLNVCLSRSAQQGLPCSAWKKAWTGVVGPSFQVCLGTLTPTHENASLASTTEELACLSS